MSLSEKQCNGIDVQTEGAGPHLFVAEDYRNWIEAEIRGAVKAVLEEILEAEIASHLGAAPGERTEARSGYRNGSYTRGLKSRVGELDVTVPRDRGGTCPLWGAYPYLYLDGISLTVRWGGASERISVLVAIGVSEEGFREVLTCTAGFRESEESWRGLFRQLTERGLHGVRLVISDACSGLKAAVSDFLPGARWQRCTVHVMRNVLDKVPQSRRAEVAAAVKTIWHQESAEEARHKASRVMEQFGRSLPAAMRTLEGALEDSLTFYCFPREHWKMLRTNNPLERLMKEIRRRTKVAEQFPHEESALLLVAARLKRIHESWSERRYLDMQPLYEREQSQTAQASAA